MKYLKILSIPLTIMWLFGFIAESQAQDFFLADNGLTVMCPDAAVGDTGEVNGITYTKRTAAQITTGNAATTCTSGITDMDDLFSFQEFNQDISNWDVSSVTDMSRMFYLAIDFNQDLSDWDVSSVTTMFQMFSRTNSFNGDISGWDVTNVTNMVSMFQFASAFNGDLSDWNVSSVTSMETMFNGASSFNGDLSNWDVSSVTNMGTMFRGASSFNEDISGWDVSSVMVMLDMFNNASSFNGDLSKWNVSSVTNMSRMFRGASSFNQDLSGWCVGEIGSPPMNFDTDASAWLLDRPDWGTCPTYDVTISGNAGWRTFALPVNNVALSDLGEQQWIQGIPGTNSAGDAEANPNLFVLEDIAGETDDIANAWVAPEDMDYEITSGQGIIWYMYDSPTEPAQPFPFTFSIKRGAPSTDITRPINENIDFNLLGNPYEKALDVSGVISWGDLQANQPWVWDPNSGTGAWVQVDEVPAFSSFMVEQAIDATGDITIPVADVVTPANTSDVKELMIALHAESSDGQVITDESSKVVFREGASNDWDVYDGSKLMPLSGSFATIGFLGERDGEERIKAIDSRPATFDGTIDIPLALNVANFGGKFTISAEMFDLPTDWRVTLIDHKNGFTTDLGKEAYTFEYGKVNMSSVNSEVSPQATLMSANDSDTRFTLSISNSEVTSVLQDGELPSHISLSQNYPNPFNPTTMINYALPQAEHVTLRVFDSIGRQVATLVNGQVAAGNHQVSFDASRLSSGVYIYQLQAGSMIRNKKMILIK